MDNITRWVGLDVHLRETAVAVIEAATGELAERRIVGERPRS